MLSEWNRDSILCRPPLLPLDTCPSLPLVHPMQIVVPLPIWSVLDRLMKKWMPSPDQRMSRMVGSILRSKLQSKFADPQETKDPKGKGCPEHQTIVFFRGRCLQPSQHVTQHFQSQRQSCRSEVNGPLEALETPEGKSQHRVPVSRALVPK